MNRDTYSETGDWIADVVRSKPEALLLLAAGCALLLRGSGSASASNMTNAAGAAMSNAGGAARDQADALHQQSSRATQGLCRAAESATEYASDVKDRDAAEPPTTRRIARRVARAWRGEIR